MVRSLTYASLIIALAIAVPFVPPAAAQSSAPQSASATEASATETEPSLKSAEELETLVAPIALYPDDLVAAVMAASLYPLQIVQAERFLEQAKTNKDLKPNSDWDGSVISLLNYPDIVKKMNDDLAWTQDLGEAVSDQQKDVLAAIQQLRGKAVASNIIKSDDKVTVEQQDDNVVIKSAKQEVTYVPQYDPEILLEPSYVVTQPIYYGDPYPSYYYPYAPYWTGFITGAVWGAAVDWDNWHSWGGDVDIDIGDIDINDIDIRNRFDFDKNKIADLDWNRDKGKFDFDRNRIADGVKNRDTNRLDRKADTGIRKAHDAANRPGAGGAGTRDVRRDVQQGLAKRDGSPGIADKAANRPSSPDRRPAQGADRPGGQKVGQGGAGQKKGPAKQAHAQRPSSKPGAKADHRPKTPSAMGDYKRGQDARMASNRGRQSYGGPGHSGRASAGHRGGGGGRHGGGGGRPPRFHR